MSDTASALKAAKEVNADTMTPELYQRATEAYFRAQNEYRLKRFNVAQDYASRAKRLAEEAEFEALRMGAARSSMTQSDASSAPAEPYEYPTPTGTPAMYMNDQPPAAGSNGTSSQNSSTPRPTPLGTPMAVPPPL